MRTWYDVINLSGRAQIPARSLAVSVHLDHDHWIGSLSSVSGSHVRGAKGQAERLLLGGRGKQECFEEAASSIDAAARIHARLVP